MKIDNNENLENFFANLERKDIQVPDDLEELVIKRINSVKNKKYYWRPFVAACIFLCSVIIGFNTIPTFSSFIINQFKGDVGTEKAALNGYKPAQIVSTTKNGYTLTIDTLTLDEERMVMVGKISGIKTNDNNIDFDMNVKDFKTPISMNGNFNNSIFSFKIEYNFFEHELKKALEANDGNLVLSALIFRPSLDVERKCSFPVESGLPKYVDYLPEHDQVIQELTDIKIPINYIKYSKTLLIDKVVNLEDISKEKEFKINSLVVSPTRMRLNYSYGKDLTFLNPSIKDEKGNIYSQIQGSRMTPNEYAVFFAPSTYFDSNIKKLYFCFDGITIYDTASPKEIRCENEILIWDGLNDIKMPHSMKRG